MGEPLEAIGADILSLEHKREREDQGVVEEVGEQNEQHEAEGEAEGILDSLDDRLVEAEGGAPAGEELALHPSQTGGVRGLLKGQRVPDFHLAEALQIKEREGLRGSKRQFRILSDIELGEDPDERKGADVLVVELVVTQDESVEFAREVLDHLEEGALAQSVASQVQVAEGQLGGLGEGV